MRTRLRDHQHHHVRRRFRRELHAGTPAYRAVTLGPGHDDWVVLDRHGDVIYRGYAMYAARMASELSAAARA
jgi:hypothetical protein